MRCAISALVFTLVAASAFGAVQTRTVEYRHAETVLEGVLVWDDGVGGPRPGVLIAHAWKGPGEYELGRARQLAEMGYAAFVLDIYGKGVRAANADEARALAGIYRADRPLMRARAQRALEELKAQPECDPARIAAIGYCFGGGVVLELARSGADLDAVVSFHGNLDSPLPPKAGDVRASILVCHGGDDPGVPMAQVNTFVEEMRSAKADWQLVIYGNAVHSFTDPGAGSDPARGSAYNLLADRRSWLIMQNFLEECFKRP